jgi:hypothetical protein
MQTLVEFKGIYFGKNTPEKVKQIVSSNIGRSNRFRFWYGDGITGKNWNEENDVCGYIGRSTGPKKIPLLIAKKTSDGGGALMDDSIIKIVDTRTKKVLYQHQNFNQSVFTITPHSDLPQFAANVLQDGSIYARCKSIKNAIRLAEFMNGKRMNK